MMICSSPSVSNRGPTLGADDVHLWLIGLEFADGAGDDPERSIAPAIDRLPPSTRRELRGASQRSVRGILAQYLGCAARDVPLDRGADGRPMLSGTRRLSFSVAHSARVMVLAVGHGARLGIDVERVRGGVRAAGLIRRFFSQREIEQLLALPPENREAAFFRTWVRKEAYLKAVGGGVPAGLPRFSASVAPGEPPAILRTELEADEASAFSLYDIDVPEGYVGAFAVEGTGHRIRYHDDAELEIRGCDGVESEMRQNL